MTSLLSSLWNSASETAGRRNSLEERRKSLENANKMAEQLEAVSPNPKMVQHAVGNNTNTNVWQGVFNPGKNNSGKQTTAQWFDNPGDSKATTWDFILKANNVKSFHQLDKNGDGFITPDELKKELRTSSFDTAALIKQADKNGDGKISLQEFNEIFRNYPSA